MGISLADVRLLEPAIHSIEKEVIGTVQLATSAPALGLSAFLELPANGSSLGQYFAHMFLRHRADADGSLVSFFRIPISSTSLSVGFHPSISVTPKRCDNLVTNFHRYSVIRSDVVLPADG